MATDHEPALALAADELERRPDDPAAWIRAAGALEAAGATAEAERAWRKALALDPQAAPAWLGLGRCLGRRGVHAEALRCHREAVRLAPDHADARVALGLSALHVADLDEATRCFQAVLARRADHADARAGLALTWVRRGRPDRAWAEASRVRPPTALAALALAEAAPRLRRNARALDAIDHALAAGGDPVLLHHARGDLLDAMGRHRAAFDAFSTANRLRGLFFDGEAHRRATRQLAAAFPAGAFAPTSRHTSARPVLIVGMPRSGTTLVEQMIGRHPDVDPRGELETLRELARAAGGYPLPPLDEAACTALSETYLAAIDGPGLRATDKMPNNVLHLGLAARLLPGARVVFVERDPVDVGWSCFRQPFGPGLPWATSLEGIAAWYGGVRALTDHWRRVLPLPTHTVVYEQLVAEPEAEIRALLAFLDLPFHPDCLAPHESGRAVATRSFAQVQEPLHRRHVRRSDPYLRWLGPVAALR